MSEVDKFLDSYESPKISGQKPAAPAAKPASEVDSLMETAPPQDKGFLGHARDLGLSAVKSAIAVPEALVGLADIPTGGRVGKFLENEGGAIGFRPKQAKELLGEFHAEAYKDQQRQFQDADGILDKTAVAIQNPSLIANTVVESAAPMLAGGVAARGLLAGTRLGQAGAIAAERGATAAQQAQAAGRAAAAAGAIGEGTMMAGSQASAIRQETDDGLLTAGQSGAAVAAGLAGTLFGYLGGRVAQRFGLGDVDTMLARGSNPQQVASEIAALPAKSIPRQVVEGAISEGFLEELPQSISEQIIQNLALGKQWSEGVEDAAVMGTLAGMAMGGGASLYSGMTRPEPQDGGLPPPTGAEPPAAPPQGFTPTAERPVIDEAALGRAGVYPPAPAPIINERALEPAAPLPSQQMGLDPAAGPMSAAAALAVDTGASATMQQAAQAVDPETGEILETGARVPEQKQATDTPEQMRERLGFIEQQARVNGGWDRRTIEERDRLQAELAKVEPVAEPPAAEAVEPAPAIDVSGRTDDQLRVLERSGRDGWREAAVAEIQRRAAQQPAETPAPAVEPAAQAAVEQQAPVAPATSIKDVLAKQIPDMTDGELQRAIDHYGPSNKRTTKLLKEMQKREQGAPDAAVQPTQASTAPEQSRPAPSPRSESAQQSEAIPPAASEGWDGMTAEQRAAVLTKPGGWSTANGGLNVIGKKLAGQNWTKINPATRATIERLMQGEQAPKATQAQEARAQEGEKAFAPETGTLGIPRADMPQVPSKSHGGLVKHLNAKGIAHETTSVDATSLKPTQAEYSPEKVEAAKTAAGDRAVIVSSDGHIVDGHHQALAAAEEGKQVKAIVLDAPIDQALEAVKNSPSAQAETSAVAERASAPTKSAAEPPKAGEGKEAGSGNVIDDLMAMEKGAGQGFKSNDRAIEVIRRATQGMDAQSKAKVSRTISKFTAVERDGTRLIKPGFYEAVAEDFAYVNYMLRDAMQDAPEFTTLKDRSGSSVTVRTADLSGARERMPMFTKDGKRKTTWIHRDNLDPTGERRAEGVKEMAGNPLFNVITTKDGGAFASEGAAERELRRRGLQDTHEVVPASEVSDGINGFVVRRTKTAAPTEAVEQQQPDAAAPAWRTVTSTPFADEAGAVLALMNAAQKPSQSEEVEKATRALARSAEESGDATARGIATFVADNALEALASHKINAGRGSVVEKARHKKLKDGIERLRSLEVERVTRGDETPAAVASQPTHKDPGQPAEPVTQPVIAEAIHKSARNTDFNPAEAKAWILGEIDKAIAGVPERNADLSAEMARAKASSFDYKEAEKKYGKNGVRNKAAWDKEYSEFERMRDDRIEKTARQIGYVSFDVPGDGKFKVVNTVEKLRDFRAKVEKSPGFAKNPDRPMNYGSGMAGAVNLDAEIRRIEGLSAADRRYQGGDVLEEIGNAIEIARLKKSKDEGNLLDRFKEASKGKDYDAWRVEQEAAEETTAREAATRQRAGQGDPQAFAQMMAMYDQPEASAQQPAQPEQPAKRYAGSADVSSRAGQMELANRGGTIAALKAMNAQLRAIAPEEAWADANIEDAADLDALRDQISVALVRANRAGSAEQDSPLRKRLEEASGADLRAVFDALGLAGGARMIQADRVKALMSEDAQAVSDALDDVQSDGEPAAAEAPAQPPAAAAAETNATPNDGRPLAAEGLNSYRYKGRYGWIMIGAKDVDGALREAARSTDDPVSIESLQSWNGSAYVSADTPTEADPESTASDLLTPDQARALMAWEDLGQRDNVKSMRLAFFESAESMAAKRGAMNYGTIESYQGGKWNIDGTTYPTLKAAKAAAEEAAIDRLRADGYVEKVRAEAEQPDSDRDQFTVERVDEDQRQTLTFKRGETVKVSGKYPMETGQIDGISNARKEFRIGGAWLPFGYAYKAEYDEFAAPRRELEEMIANAEKRIADGIGFQRDGYPIREAREHAKRYSLEGYDDTLNDLAERGKVAFYRRLAEEDARRAAAAQTDRERREAADAADAAKYAGPVKMTMDEWKRIHRDFKSFNGGNRTVMQDGRIRRVEIVKEKAEAPATESTAGYAAQHEALMASVRTGKATPEAFKASFEQVVANEDAIKAELSAKTKAALLRDGGPYLEMRYANEKKDSVVDAVYRQMIGEYALGESVTYGMARDSYQKAVRRMVEATDADKLAQYVLDREAAIQEAEVRRTARAEAMANPQTLNDYRSLMNAHIREGKTRHEAFLMLTPEQRIRYDELEAEGTREAREARKRAAQNEVRAAGQTTGGQIIATKHTRDGYDLFVVQLAERLSREDYNTVLAGAKRLGGRYSAFRGNGAVPGFQFRTREDAEAFLKLAGGDVAAAKDQVEQRRDAFADDRSQTAAERLAEMADRMEQDADAEENRDRKANTTRRARFASAALNAAAAQKAMARTMRNIAQAIQEGRAKFLDTVRTRTQVDALLGYVRTAKDKELRAKYPSYADQEKRKGEPATAETAGFADFPSYTAFRSDLAMLGRQMLEIDGTKKLGQKLMSVADDVTDAYLEFARDNIRAVSQFGRGDALAEFANRESAERAIRQSGLVGKAIVLPIKRGQNRVILSPSEAMNRKVWAGDGDKRITLSGEFGKELVEAIGRRGNKTNGLAVPWQFQNAYDRRKLLSRIGIETPSEFRSALREVIALQETAVTNKVREMELAMVGRRADGLDFFPTPAEIADQMVEAADITPDMAVLEPSAGMGHIADRIREAGAEPDVIEISAERRELLEEKGYHLAEVDNFMNMEPRSFFTYGDLFRAPDGVQGVMRGVGHMGSQRVRLEDEQGNRLGLYNRDEVVGVAHRGSWSGYDRIIMNPPFSDRRDAEHVQHAYTLLRPGGRIVAIMGEGVFFGQDKRAQDFRDWLDSVGGTSEKLPEGSFMDPALPVQTGVNARMVVIDRPAVDDGIRQAGEADPEMPFSATLPRDRNAVRVGITEKGLLRAMRIQFDGLAEITGKLLERGRAGKRGGVIVVGTADNAEIGRIVAERTGRKLDATMRKFSSAGRINGFYDPKSGLTFLVGPNLNPVTATAVMLHEMMHGQQRQKIDARALEMVRNRHSLKDEDLRAFLDRVMLRMIGAGEVGNAAEASAYIVEQAVIEGRSAGYTFADGAFMQWVDAKIGKRVGDFLRSFAGMIRTWMLRNGLGAKTMTVDDFVGYAMAGLERAVAGSVRGRANAKASIDAWHGSPYRFDRFDLGNVGMGEGAQAYGWGLYFADSKEVAEHYRNMGGYSLTPANDAAKARFSEATNFAWGAVQGVSDALENNKGDIGKTVARLRSFYADTNRPEMRAAYLTIADMLEAGDLTAKREGATYKVRIAPDEDTFLLWDKPLSEQPKKVTQGLRSAIDAMFGDGTFDTYAAAGNDWRDMKDNMLENMSEKDVSLMLKANGVVGVKYLDGMSRDGKGGSFNYVVFDDADVEIDEMLFSRSVGDAPAQEAQRVQSAIEGKTLIEAAQFMTRSKDGAKAAVAQKVMEKLQRLEKAGVALDLKIVHRGDMAPASMVNARGYTETGFDEKGRDIVVWLNGADVTGKVGTEEEVLLHELVHAATAGMVFYGTQTPDSLAGKHARDLMAVTDAIAEHIRKRFDAADAGKATLTEFEQDMREGANNAFRSDDEVLAWALSSGEAQAYLETIPYRSGSMWSNFVQAVRNLLGLSARNDTTLSEVLRVADRILTDDAPNAGRAAFWHKRNIRMAQQQARGSIAQTAERGDEDLQFSRSGMRAIASRATTELNNALTAPGKLSWWHKTIGTMYNLAERSPTFKPVFQAAQGFIDDVSHYAADAAERAPKLLPRLDTWRDILTSPISAEDNKAVGKPIFEGTLSWTRDAEGRPVRVDALTEAAAGMTVEAMAAEMVRRGAIEERTLRMWRGLPEAQFESAIRTRYENAFLQAGIVWTDDELASMFSLTPAQIELYREFRAAVDRSLDTMARADMLRFAGEDVRFLRDPVMEADTLREAASLIVMNLSEQANAQPDRAEQFMATSQGVMDRMEKVLKLQATGYAPLSRFGKYTVDVVVDGNREYFGLFESAREANKMAERMRAEFGAGTVTQGTLSDEAFRLFAGITPESLELFGNMLGLESTGNEAQDRAFQEYLRLTKTNRSALRRLIHRKGIAGFSEDVSRVLASFAYSNARQTAAGLHMGDLSQAVSDIPKEQGELKDVAVKLSEYIKNPQEEAQAIRGLLFAQYLGGSVASAFVNMTQPAAVTFPWLSQHGGAKMAAAEIGKAAKHIATRGHRYESDLAEALKAAEEDGVVSPQEVHQLMAQARGSGSLMAGDGTRAGNARALASNSITRLSAAWGKLFSAAEQLNRRITFIAAYRVAKQKRMEDPAAFARRAVQETQFVYSKASKMQWGRGAVGGTLMTFKTYSVAYMELMSRLWSQGAPGSAERKAGRKAVALMLAMVLLMGGGGGLPFMEDAEDLIDGIAQIAGYNVSTKKARQQFLIDTFGADAADFIERGVSGLPGVPLDVSGRLGLGNLIPGTGVFLDRSNHTRDILELLGPVGDLGNRIVTGARKALSGDVGGAALEVSPVAVRNVAKGIDMAAMDQYRDTRGRKVLDTTDLEAALKAIGFQPASVAKVQDANYLNQRAKDFYSLSADRISATWAAGIYEKDSDKVQKARDMIARWNEDNPDQPMMIRMPNILRRVREMGKDKAQRIADTAPRAMRQQLREELMQP